MKKYLVLILCLLGIFSSPAQTGKRNLAGLWKCYLDDRINFDYLQLNVDGTGLKCFGQTINGKDSLLTDHITALVITKWEDKGDYLYLNSRNTLSYLPDPAYAIHWIDEDKVELTGEHLKFNLYPSILNRKEFARTVTYQKAERITGDYGVASAACIVAPNTVTFTPIDSSTSMARYGGFDDLIPHIVSCQPGYVYAQHYKDPPYQLAVPSSVKNTSYGFGEGNFYISLNSPEGDTPITSIVLYYDFNGKYRSFYFSQLKGGKEKTDIVRVNNHDIYRSINWQGKFAGEVFLEKGLSVAYYTKDKRIEGLLQQCVASFEYR
jgi:hypothetical protein